MLQSISAISFLLRLVKRVERCRERIRTMLSSTMIVRLKAEIIGKVFSPGFSRPDATRESRSLGVLIIRPEGTRVGGEENAHKGSASPAEPQAPSAFGRPSGAERNGIRSMVQSMRPSIRMPHRA